MTALHPGQLVHVGITAVDLDQAKAELSAQLGVTWRGGSPRVMDLVLYGQERQVEMRIAHTAEGAPHLELIQCIPDTPWAEASQGVHHLCYFSEDSVAVGLGLEAAGHRRILGRSGTEGGYFQSPSGVIVEVIGVATRDYLARIASSAPREG